MFDLSEAEHATSNAQTPLSPALFYEVPSLVKPIFESGIIRLSAG